MADLLIKDVTLHNLATPIQELGGTTDQISIATMQSTIEEANEEIITQTDLIEQLKIKLQASASDKIWKIVPVEEAKYGFKLDEEGYYTSQNSGVNSSAALCKLTFDTIEPYDLYLDCINYGETSYDFSVFSKLNVSLGIDCNSEGQYAQDIRNHASVYDYIDTHQTSKTITYSKISGKGFITIKFRKDHVDKVDPDCLRFKVRAEPAAVEQATPAISLNTSTGLITATSIQAAGRVVEGTKSSTLQLNTKTGTTITPGSSEKTAISANTYALGAIKVAGDSDLEAGNIKSGVTIFNTTGTFTKVDSNAATTSDIRSNKIAYVNGEEITGSLPEYGAGFNMSYSSITDDTAANAQIKVKGTRTNSSCIINKNSTTELKVPASNFGNATRDQVLDSSTFTSSAGLAVTGNIATKTSSDVIVNNNTVTIPAGYYASAIDKDVNPSNIVDGFAIIPKVQGASYGFKLQSDGYYKSTNYQVNSSAAVARVLYNFSTSTVIKVDAIITCEASHDTGIISNFNQPLSTTNSKDSPVTATLTCTTSGATRTSTTTFPATSGAGFFDIKYRKDSSVNSGADCLKFIVYTGDSPEAPEGSSGSNTPARTESDIIVSGNTVTIPAGYYASDVEKTVSGSSLSQGAVVKGPPVSSHNMGYVYSYSSQSSSITANYSSSASYNSSTQKLTLGSSSSLTITSSSSASDILSTLQGKYVTFTGASGTGTATTTSDVFYIPSTASFKYSTYTWTANNIQVCIPYYE